jgi:hypothetical protein
LDEADAEMMELIKRHMEKYVDDELKKTKKWMDEMFVKLGDQAHS